MLPPIKTVLTCYSISIKRLTGLGYPELSKSFLGPCYYSKVVRNGIRVGDLRHMDTLSPKARPFCYLMPAARFQGLQYTPDMLLEEAEAYKRYAERLEPYITDIAHFTNDSKSQKKRILVEHVRH